MSKKIKANRRKTVRAKKKAAADEAAKKADRQPVTIIGWFCTDPDCVEGIHHLDPIPGGDSR